jgi:hypothetical protein
VREWGLGTFQSVTFFHWQTVGHREGRDIGDRAMLVLETVEQGRAGKKARASSS